ncbi:hypothetical protein VNO77_04969 [Canavalia gladiata]|uniref:Uncharacterized protein n=1 Tax=Canavalia gladiata TaxID=3824 RepID=A0AAN9MXG5_CANGL
MEPGKFDTGHCGELLKHMDKQNEVLMEAYRSMLHELQKLQVEEEMLMRKLYEVMSTHGLTKLVRCSALSHFLFINTALAYLFEDLVTVIYLQPCFIPLANKKSGREALVVCSSFGMDIFSFEVGLFGSTPIRKSMQRIRNSKDVLLVNSLSHRLGFMPKHKVSHFPMDIFPIDLETMGRKFCM